MLLLKKMKNNVIKNITNKTLGILGGGQLGKMIAVEASRLGIKTCIFDPNENAPAFQNANIIVNSDYNNKKALKNLLNTQIRLLMSLKIFL